MASNTHGQSSPSGAPAKGTGKYQWGKGGKVHSIPLATHEQNLAAVNALGGRSLTAPPDAAQAYREANAAADVQFGPQVAAAQQQVTNTPAWFAEHLARVAGYARAAQALANPVLAQAQTFQTNTGSQLPPGLDPNSAAGQQAAQAAQGRQAIAQLGLDALNTQNTSTQDYFSGQQGVASRELPQAQTAAAQALANAQSQRGAAVNSFLTQARQNAENYAIARGTLGLNTEKAAADVASTTATATERARHNRASERNTAASRIAAARAKGETVNKYGYTTDQWSRFSPGHRQQIMQQLGQGAGTGKDAKKHADAITKASGSVQNTIQDIIGQWDSYTRRETDDTTKPIMKNGQPVKGPDGKPTYEGRKLTPDEIRRSLAADNRAYTPQLIHIALLRRVGKPLDQASIDYLHNLNPDIRIPRSWLAPVVTPHPRGGSPAGGAGGTPYGTGAGQVH